MLRFSGIYLHLLLIGLQLLLLHYNVPIYVFRQTEIYCPQLVTHFRANVRRILDYRLKFDYSEACLKMRLDLRDSFMWLSWNYYQISLMVQSRKTSFTICLNLRK